MMGTASNNGRARTTRVLSDADEAVIASARATPGIAFQPVAVWLGIIDTLRAEIARLEDANDQLRESNKRLSDRRYARRECT